MNKYRKTIKYCYVGYIVQALVNNLLPLFFVIFRSEYGISNAKLGSLISLNFLLQLTVDLIVTKIGSRLGYRRAMLIAHSFATIGLVSITVLPMLISDTFLALCLATLFFAIGGGLIEVMVSPLMDSIDLGSKSGAMSLLHSFYCWGQVLVVAGTTLLLSVFGSEYWYIMPLVWAVIPFLNIFPFIKSPLPPMLAEEKRVPLKRLFKSPKFIMLIVLMVAAGAFELAMSQWASFFAEKGLGVSKTMGDLLGPCLFAVFMGIARVVYGVLGERLNLRNSMFFCCCLGIACYLAAGLSPNVWIALSGCALCGFSVGLMWPGTLSLAGKSFAGGTQMFGILALAGDLGCSAGPFLTGLVSDIAEQSEGLINLASAWGISLEQAAIKLGILSAVIFPIIALIALFLHKKSKRSSLE